MGAQVLVGIEIGGTKLQLVLGDEAGTVKERRRLAVDVVKGALGIRQQIQRELPTLTQDTRITAVGVGFGGPVDWQTGKICLSHQIEGWSGFDLGGWLAEITGAPVRVDNDANVAALGEARFGAGAGLNPVFYITLGSGVGGGVVVNGEIYHGATPGEAEIGHVRLDRKGTTIETRCSGWAVDKRIRRTVRQKPAGKLARLVKGATKGEAIFLSAAVRGGDAAAKKILASVAEDLAFGLSHVTHLFHPEVIILGGGLSGMGELLRKAVAQAAKNFIMEAFAPGPRIVLAALGEDAVPVGALELARRAVMVG